MSITPALEILNTHGVHPSSEEPHGSGMYFQRRVETCWNHRNIIQLVRSYLRRLSTWWSTCKATNCSPVSNSLVRSRLGSCSHWSRKSRKVSITPCAPLAPPPLPGALSDYGFANASTRQTSITWKRQKSTKKTFFSFYLAIFKKVLTFQTSIYFQVLSSQQSLVSSSPSKCHMLKGSQPQSVTLQFS